MNAGPTWIVVADGARARLFEQLRPGAAVVERESFARYAAPAAQSRDRLPRTHDRTGPGRHAIEPRQTPHEGAERTFLSEVGREIARHALARAFNRLVLCAPPRRWENCAKNCRANCASKPAPCSKTSSTGRKRRLLPCCKPNCPRCQGENLAP
jgi:protein required for attachment to host cells